MKTDVNNWWCYVRNGSLRSSPYFIYRATFHVYVISMLTWAASWLDGQGTETPMLNSVVLIRHWCRVNRDLLCASSERSSRNSCEIFVVMMAKQLWNCARWNTFTYVVLGHVSFSDEFNAYYLSCNCKCSTLYWILPQITVFNAWSLCCLDS